MNIFILDFEPKLAAKYHCDKHVPKMILETAQLLSTAHVLTKSRYSDLVYKPTHINHPCSIWVRESKDNYCWAWDLFYHLNNEFFMRRGKIHLTYTKLKDILCHTPELPLKGLTKFAQAMPDQYKDICPVKAYRNYYLGAKDFAKWEWPNSSVPFWWEKIKTFSA
jgi:hypothetical protein